VRERRKACKNQRGRRRGMCQRNNVQQSRNQQKTRNIKVSVYLPKGRRRMYADKYSLGRESAK
jgi:hypothetical protein